MSEPCAHYWLIEPAQGPESQGWCAYCGESRTFQNSIPEMEDRAWWEHTRVARHRGLKDGANSYV